MILVDSSVWIGHLRSTDEQLMRLLESGQVLTHPSIIGELAVGHLADRTVLLTWLGSLQASLVASHEEILALIENNFLFGRGIGYLDAEILASVRLTTGSRLWTKDRRLLEAARDLDALAYLEN